MPRIEVEVENMAFQFDSKAAWIAHAQHWYRRAGLTSQNAICVDATGRICLNGKEFARAEVEGTYPIRVYAVQSGGFARRPYQGERISDETTGTRDDQPRRFLL